MYNDKALRTSSSFWDEASNDVDYFTSRSLTSSNAAMDAFSRLVTTANSESLCFIRENTSEGMKIDLEDDEDIQYLCESMSNMASRSSMDIMTSEAESQMVDGRQDTETHCPRTPRRLHSFYGPSEGCGLKTEKSPSSPTCVSLFKASAPGVTIPLPSTEDSPELIEATQGSRKWLRPRSSIGIIKGNVFSIPEPQQLRDDDETQTQINEWSRRSSSSVVTSSNNNVGRVSHQSDLRDNDETYDMCKTKIDSMLMARRRAAAQRERVP